MAIKRMFARTIVESDAFITMSPSAQALYFHFGMEADDDGFVNSPIKITRMIGANKADYMELVGKKFIYEFPSGVIVIKHWNINNNIREERKKDTAYPEEMSMLTTKENGAYKLKSDSCQTIDGQLTDSCQTIDGQTTDKRQAKARTDKYSIDKYSIDKGSIGETSACACEEKKDPLDVHNQIGNMYNSICKSLPKFRGVSATTMNLVHDRLKQYSIKDFETLFEKAEASSFLKGHNDRGWRATFEWLLKDSNMSKVLNGNYDDRIAEPKKNKTAQDLDDFYDMMNDWAENSETEETGT